MKVIKWISIGTLILLTLACSKKIMVDEMAEKTEQVMKADLPQLSIVWSLDSFDKENSQSTISWTFKNAGEVPLQKDWTIYFSQIVGKPVAPNIGAGLMMEHITADYYKLTPTSEFAALDPGEERKVTYTSSGVVQRASDAAHGAYLVIADHRPQDIDFRNERIVVDNPESYGFPTPASRFEENASLSLLPQEELAPFIPRPVDWKRGADQVNWTGLFTVDNTSDFQHLSDHLLKLLENQLGVVSDDRMAQTPFKLSLSIDPSAMVQSEAYTLSVNSQDVSIVGTDHNGLLYGIESFVSYLHTQDMANGKIQTLQVADYPRFGYRGLHFDVSRNFHSKDKVLQILDAMSRYKLNTFHFHITDDEGWRLEIDGLPELTTVGALRGHTIDEMDHTYPVYGSGPDPLNSYGSGYYTRAEFIEILKYAADRGIDVIPEIDLPGHSRAAIKAMTSRYHRLMKEGREAEAKQYLLEDFKDESVYTSAQLYSDNAMCICQESSFAFIERVVDDIVGMYADAGLKLTALHSGGDEVAYGAWQKSPICQKFVADNDDLKSTDDLHAYFLGRFTAMLDKYDIISAGWEEITLKHSVEGHQTTQINPDQIGKPMQVYVWNSKWGWGREDMVYKLANAGFPVVMSNSSELYFDMAYNTDPEERGLSWSGFTDTKSGFFLTPLDLSKMDKAAELEGASEMVKLTEEGEKNFLGIQGQLWSETITQERFIDYHIFPKILSMAERAWAPKPAWVDSANKDDRSKDWNAFANAIGQNELPILNKILGGIDYRIPLPGAKVVDGKLHANVKFPGMEIRYSEDGKEPTALSKLYTEPVSVKGKIIKLKTFTSEGRSSRTSTLTLN